MCSLSGSDSVGSAGSLGNLPTSLRSLLEVSGDTVSDLSAGSHSTNDSAGGACMASLPTTLGSLLTVSTDMIDTPADSSADSRSTADSVGSIPSDWYYYA